MAQPWVRNQRLHPVLSNLLPEGSSRELIAQGLKVHVDNEFHILSYLGADLPGAIEATPMEPEDVPEYVLSTHGKAKAVELDIYAQENKFSLAGVQMKFSMKEKDGRYNLSKSPAYDIVTTSVYIDNETQYALKLGKTKEWYIASLTHFQAWASQSGIPWLAIKPHLDDTLNKARELWPESLEALRMDDEHKAGLKAHWGKLNDDLKIDTEKRTTREAASFCPLGFLDSFG